MPNRREDPQGLTTPRRTSSDHPTRVLTDVQTGLRRLAARVNAALNRLDAAAAAPIQWEGEPVTVTPVPSHMEPELAIRRAQDACSRIGGPSGVAIRDLLQRALVIATKSHNTHTKEPAR